MGFTPYEHTTNAYGNSDKFGLLCVGCHEQHYEALTPVANWTYNFRLFPHETFPVEWAVQNDVEFVGMIPHQHEIDYNNDEYCDARVEKGKPLHCDLQRLIDTVNTTKATGMRFDWLMGFNEPYADEGKEGKDHKALEPKTAAKFWG